MIIIGIDPGIATLGYGIITFKHGNFTVVDFGAVITTSKHTTAERLVTIYDELVRLVNEYKPDHAAVEELFFNKNSKTAMLIGQARGVSILAAASSGIKAYEYTPLQVKQAVAGYGRASKKQVQQMTKMILNLNKIPRPDDAADALAVAICHAHSVKINSVLKKYL